MNARKYHKRKWMLPYYYSFPTIPKENTPMTRAEHGPISITQMVKAKQEEIQNPEPLTAQFASYSGAETKPIPVLQAPIKSEPEEITEPWWTSSFQFESQQVQQGSKMILETVQRNAIQGVEVSASTTVRICANQQSFSWKQYGLKLHIPDGCLPMGENECMITIMVSIAGQYDFPENCYPVSAIFWLRCEPACTFLKPLTLEMDHCAKRENASKLYFVRGVCSQKNLPYTFRKLKQGVFNQHTSYGIVELHNFSGIAVVQEDSAEREYCAMLFYLGKTALCYEFQIHFLVTWNTSVHISVVNEVYQEKQAQSGHTQPIGFESNQITLDIPMSGVISEGWKISPFFPPVIEKKRVDNFEPGKDIPSCQLSAMFGSSKTTEIPSSLQYCVKLLGAKRPYDMFNIIPTSTATINATNKAIVLIDKKPKLKDLLMELCTKMASKWDSIGIMLEIEGGQLSRIKADCGSDSANCLKEMLQIWLNQVEPPPTWSIIAETIEHLGNAELARHLRTKYCTQKQ